MSMNRRDFIKGSMAAADGLILPSYLVGCGKSNGEAEYDIVDYGETSAGVIAVSYQSLNEQLLSDGQVLQTS